MMMDDGSVGGLTEGEERQIMAKERDGEVDMIVLLEPAILNKANVRGSRITWKGTLHNILFTFVVSFVCPVSSSTKYAMICCC